MGGQKGRTADWHVLYKLWAHIHFWLDLRWSISLWVSACACHIIPMFSRLLSEKWNRPHSQLWWEEVQFYSFVMDELCWVDGQGPFFGTWAHTHIYMWACLIWSHTLYMHKYHMYTYKCLWTHVYEHWILGNSWIPSNTVKCSQNIGFVLHIQTFVAFPMIPRFNSEVLGVATNWLN